MSVIDSLLTALSFVLIRFFFEREKYEGEFLRLSYILAVEVIIFAIIIFFASKLFG